MPRNGVAPTRVEQTLTPPQLQHTISQQPTANLFDTNAKAISLSRPTQYLPDPRNETDEAATQAATPRDSNRGAIFAALQSHPPKGLRSNQRNRRNTFVATDAENNYLRRSIKSVAKSSQIDCVALTPWRRSGEEMPQAAI